MASKILLIEDNVLISKSIEQKLKDENYHVKAVFNGEDAIDQFSKDTYDCVLLDLMLPKVSGEDVLKFIRSKGETPVMIISTKDTDVEKAINLGLGADDYLSKPFSMLELLARVKALLRRSRQSEEKPKKNIYNFNDLSINLSTYQVVKKGEVLELTLKEFEILKLLLTHPDQTFSKQEMYRKIWNEEYYFNDNVINVHIRRLRKKIENDPSNPEIVITMWGFGYKLGQVGIK
ncbi:MAG: response regulator transcription factor [Acholeplasmataceae bacterium]|nr:response regulator transcription factor [Acholeplasmataceae bacterium]